MPHFHKAPPKPTEPTLAPFVRAICTTREWEDANGTVIGSVELRIHYQFTPGSKPTHDDPCGWGPEIEFDFVESEVADFFGHNRKWKRVDPGFDGHNMIDGDNVIDWAADYLHEHHDEVIEDVAAIAADAEEYRAECRRDQRMMER